MRSVVGFALVAAGAIGTLVPIVPGFALVLAGIAVLGPDHRLSRALIRRGRTWTGKSGEPAGSSNSTSATDGKTRAQ